jgi:hypothetical protein
MKSENAGSRQLESQKGDPRGCYVILTINEIISNKDKGSVQVNFIRFDYDIEKAARAVEESVLPDEYAEMLRKAY